MRQSRESSAAAVYAFQEGEVKLGPDNDAAFTVPRFRGRLAELGIRRRPAAATATPRARPSSGLVRELERVRLLGLLTQPARRVHRCALSALAYGSRSRTAAKDNLNRLVHHEPGRCSGEAAAGPQRCSHRRRIREQRIDRAKHSFCLAKKAL
jgi:hypothetical protein